MEKIEHAYKYVKTLELPPKPRKSWKTEVRIPYYSSVVTRTYIKEVLETWSEYFDGLKFACGTHKLLPKSVVREIIKMAHDYDVYVSTGGFVERVTVDGSKAVDAYFDECKDLGFDVIEISNGFVTSMTLEDKVAMVKKVRSIGLRPKPEITLMKGAGAGTHIVGYKTEMKPISEAIKEAKMHIRAGAKEIMMESEGITEDLPPEKWRTDIIKKLISEFGYGLWMFEAADPEVFKWYLKHIGKDVNLFIDHTQITEYNAWRLGYWGDRDIWKGQKFSYKH
ncbi:MAG: phosphosulfolactate synthase [Candidatus Micrarchaeales archaeon]|nr:phosphosulfolactate synthase [Candidatus Micrarchaeales archaeon]